MVHINDAYSRWKHLLTKAILEPGVAEVDLVNLPEWLDQRRFEKGQLRAKSHRLR